MKYATSGFAASVAESERLLAALEADFPPGLRVSWAGPAGSGYTKTGTVAQHPEYTVWDGLDNRWPAGTGVLRVAWDDPPHQQRGWVPGYVAADALRASR